MTPRLFARFGVLLLVVLVSACSSIKFAYNFADEAVEGRAEDYLDLDEDGAIELRAETENLIAWHRAEMLPKYAVYLNQWADHAALGQWSRDDVANVVGGFRSLLDDTARGAAPFMANVLINHTSDEKLEYLHERMEEKLAERKADEAEETAEEDIAERAERRTDFLARFIGDLREDQLEIVRAHATKNHDASDRWLVNREMRQEAFIEFMAKEPSKADIEDFAFRILMRPWEITDPDYREISEGRWEQFVALYYDIFVTLDDEQKDTFVFNLRRFAEDMVEISTGS